MESPEKQVLTAESIILRWDSDDRKIFDSDRHVIDQYLLAVDQIQSDGSDQSSSLLHLAMSRLGDEFRSLLLRATSSPATSSSAISDLQDSNHHSSGNGNSKKGEDDDVSGSVGYSEDDVSIRSSIQVEDDVSRSGSDDVSRTSRDDVSSKGWASTVSTSSITELELVPDGSTTAADLRSIATRMVAAGCRRECVDAYADVRKPELKARLRALGVGRLGIGDLQRLEWDSVERKIRRWIKAVRVCVRILFASEKRLCKQIFRGLGAHSDNNDGSAAEADDIDDVCFMETVKGFAIQLFNFAEAISISQRSPEKLFKIIDLYDTLADLLPDVETVFDSKQAESVRVQATEILSRLADAAIGILSEFENKVLCEPSTVPVPGGTIHPLTRYVMNYINLISDYKPTMIELITSKPSMGSIYSGDGDPTTPDIDLDEFEGRAPLSIHLVWIIAILQFNLEGKSKHYKDASLAHLFLMNNVHYIVTKIKGCPELREMIGDDYLKKLKGKYRQAATSYQRSTWVRVLYCLRDEGLHVSGGFSSGVSKRALKERFKAFNAMFDEVHRVQATWIVPDNQLREELRIEILELLIPAYRSFLGRFRGYIESGRHPEAYIKYSVEDLENLALDFFEDCQGSQHSRRGSQL